MTQVQYDVRNFTVADVVAVQQFSRPEAGVLLVPAGLRAKSLSLRVAPVTLPQSVYLAYRIGATGAPVPLRAGDAVPLNGTTAGVFACFAFDDTVAINGNNVFRYPLVVDVFTSTQLAYPIQFFTGL